MNTSIKVFILSITKPGLTKNVFLILITLIFTQFAFSQSPDSARRTRIYHVNYLTGSIIIAGGLGTDYFAISRIKDKPNLTTAELAALNTDVINPIDRWALQQDGSQHLKYSKLSDEIGPPIFILLPAMLGFDKRIRKDWFSLLFMYLEGH